MSGAEILGRLALRAITVANWNVNFSLSQAFSAQDPLRFVPSKDFSEGVTHIERK